MLSQILSICLTLVLFPETGLNLAVVFMVNMVRFIKSDVVQPSSSLEASSNCSVAALMILEATVVGFRLG